MWSLKHAAALGLDLEALPEPPRAGLTSVPANPQVPDAFYRACGYHSCGPRAVRMDMIERLADLIRPLIAWRRPEGSEHATPPKGSTGDGAFVVIPEMMSILGCSSDEMGLVLKVLGFSSQRRPKRKPQPRLVAVDTPVDVAAPVDATAETAAPPPAEVGADHQPVAPEPASPVPASPVEVAADAAAPPAESTPAAEPSVVVATEAAPESVPEP